MVVYGFSGIVGLFGGGIAADALYRRRVDGRLLVATAALLVSMPPMFLALLVPRGDVLAFSLLMGLGIGVMYAYYATVYSTIQDIVAPSLRGTAMALYFCAMYLLGASLGPLGTGAVVRRGALRRSADDRGRSEGQLARRAEPVPSGGPAQGPVPRSNARGDPLCCAVRRVAEREEGRPRAAVADAGGGTRLGTSHTPGKVITPRAFSPRSMSAKA
jgi:hypothetical protein